MKWFQNLKISAKLILTFLFMAVIAVAVGLVGLYNMARIEEAATLLYEENALGIKYSGNAATGYQRLKYNLCEAIMLEGGNSKEEYVEKLNNYVALIDESLAAYEAGIISRQDREMFDELKPQWEEYRAHMQRTIHYVELGTYLKAKNVLLEEADAIGDALRESLAELVEYNGTKAAERAQQNEILAQTAEILTLIIVAIGMILAVVMGLFIANIISKPIKKIVTAAEKLAVGDMDITQTIFTKDELGELATTFIKLVDSTRAQAENVQRIADGDLTVEVDIRSEKDLLGQKLSEMVQKINGVMLNIASAAEQVSAGARQISDSSMMLSQGATEQASAIEELTASIEEVSSQTKVNADNASQANELAESAKAHAVEGNTHMQGMLKAMEEINTSSSDINKIIKVIDDIAFQTNILALNAAVEAARAGQYGKGFAVVAEEVRNLAAQSAKAAKETTSLIEGSIKKVEGGTKIAKETAQALQEIVDGVEAVSSLISHINTASNEQAAAIDQINEGIMQVSQVVQENSATSEEGASASEELSGQAETLNMMVGKFKVKRVS